MVGHIRRGCDPAGVIVTILFFTTSPSSHVFVHSNSRLKQAILFILEEHFRTTSWSSHFFCAQKLSLIANNKRKHFTISLLNKTKVYKIKIYFLTFTVQSPDQSNGCDLSVLSICLHSFTSLLLVTAMLLALQSGKRNSEAGYNHQERVLWNFLRSCGTW